MEKSTGKHIKTYVIWLAGIWTGIIFLNLLAWCSASFCDFYVVHIFPVWVSTYGRLMGLFRFSVGEWLLYLAVLYLIIDFILIPIGIWQRKKKAGKVILGWLKVALCLITFVCLIMTLNCVILYHCSPIEDQLTANRAAGEQRADHDAGTESLEKLVWLREYIVQSCNALSEVMERDASGDILYSGDMAAQAISAMRGISDQFPRLSGYYPRPKPLWASWFYSQQYMCGYYFPFSMEANYNDMMYIMNIPTTMCHELSHLRGYIYEDEANFLAYLACVESGDDLFAYSGYLGVLYYVEEDLQEALMAAGQWERYDELTPITDQVRLDNRFLTSQAWERVERISFLDTNMVSALSDDFLEANLTINGVSEGVASYSKVVELLLLYYQ